MNTLVKLLIVVAISVTLVYTYPLDQGNPPSDRHKVMLCDRPDDAHPVCERIK